MEDRERLGIEKRKGIYVEGWKVESRDNSVVLWCTSGWIWRKVENNRAGDENYWWPGVIRNIGKYMEEC